MAGPAVRDLELYRGDDYTHQINFVTDEDTPEPMNLTDYEFRAQIRDRPEGSTAVRATFNIDISQSGEGIIVLSLPPGTTRIKAGYWDLEVYDGNITETWLKGSVTLDGDVTKAVTT
jgi:hypothetical protein